MRVFIAGIMQGSIQEAGLHGQDYRVLVRNCLAEHFPEAHIYDPFEDHTESLNYDAEQAREVFLTHNRLCGRVDLLVAYVPEASMGTAIEMWEAHQNAATVVAITPLEHNWAIRFTSDLMYPNLATFVQAVESGELATFLETNQR
jgi:hypothetical protein